MIFDYPYTDMHELNLDWFLAKFKELVEEWNQVQSEWTSLHDYVQNYFDNLNVQTEINNKINAMIADGSFALILTPLVEAALPTIVDGKLPAVVASQIGAVVASQIDAVVAGQLPAIAAAAAAQEVGTWLAAHIDPDTGYVIDDSLTVAGAAADAKTVGDLFNDLDWYGYVAMDPNDVTIQTNMSWRTDGSAPVPTTGYTAVSFNCKAGEKYRCVGINIGVNTGLTNINFYNSSNVRVAYINNIVQDASRVSEFTVPADDTITWVGYTQLTDNNYLSQSIWRLKPISELETNLNTLRTDFDNVVKQYQTDTASLDADTLKNGIISFTKTTTPSHFPVMNYANGAIVFTVRVSDDSLSTYDRQFVINKEYLAIRVYSGGWQSWTLYHIGSEFKNIITTHPDVYSLDNGSYYFVSASTPTGMPNTNYGAGSVITIARSNPGQNSDYDKIYVETRRVTFLNQYYNGAWSGWIPIKGTVTCGTDQDYTTLREACEMASVYGINVLVYPGTYDLITEFATEIAAKSTTGFTGIHLNNGIHLTFMHGAYVTAVFDNTDTWTETYFNPFDSLGSYTIENLNIYAKNCRYCIHDEMAGNSTPYIHKYIDCDMTYENTFSTPAMRQCIGGGLGINGTIIIEGGTYHSITDSQICISYHNGLSASCDSKISIRDVYLSDDGYFRFGNHGVSTILSKVTICNCSMGAAISEIFESAGDSTVNFEVTAFLNEIRS